MCPTPSSDTCTISPAVRPVRAAGWAHELGACQPPLPAALLLSGVPDGQGLAPLSATCDSAACLSLPALPRRQRVALSTPNYQPNCCGQCKSRHGARSNAEPRRRATAPGRSADGAGLQLVQPPPELRSARSACPQAAQRSCPPRASHASARTHTHSDSCMQHHRRNSTDAGSLSAAPVLATCPAEL